MLGKIEGKRRRGRQRMRWLLDSITDSMDMNLSKLFEIVEDWGVWKAVVHWVSMRQTWLSNRKTTRGVRIIFFPDIWSWPPSSWHRSPKSLGISWVVRASFVLMRWLLVGSWIDWLWGPGHKKDYVMIKSLETFSLTTHPLGKGGRLEIELMINYAYVMNPS